MCVYIYLYMYVLTFTEYSVDQSNTLHAIYLYRLISNIGFHVSKQ